MFQLSKVSQTAFYSFDELLEFLAIEKKQLSRLPLEGLWRNGARFAEDRHFGVGDTWFAFNDNGLDALCRLLGVPADTLHRLPSNGLASAVLNDLLRAYLEGSGIRARNTELVVDEGVASVIGVVSGSYVGYANHDFLQDLILCLHPRAQRDLFPKAADFDFKEAYSINSRVFVRMTSKKVRGRIDGYGGKGSDVSEIGVELSNSMAGGHALRLNWYVHRLICANGLTAKVAGQDNRVVHSGSEAAFQRRLQVGASSIFGSLDRARRMVETLGGLEFDAARLAGHATPEAIFKIVPNFDLKSTALRQAGNSEGRDGEKRKADLADAIAAVPWCIGGAEARRVFDSHWRDGASMYDFVNIFTEHAKSLPLKDKVETETRAGDLATWIAANRRKFESRAR
jgi:hypothetical protein